MATQSIILLAEDDDRIRGLLSQVLTRRGYVVLEATDGAEALKLFDLHSGNVHMLLSDVRMPGMTGIELAFELRRRREDLPILLMSGYVSQLTVPFDFIAKPFLLPALLEKVERHLSPGQRPKT